jgi:hypothetical protein
MKIDVHDAGNHFDHQTRAYAEYRVFSTLAALSDVVHEVGVGLARADAARPSSSADVFVCRVSIRLRTGEHMDVASHARHPYQAIDRAARQLATVVGSHIDAAAESASSNSGGESDMNTYRILGDNVGTTEARVLAEQLVAWHDSMVKHLRVVGPRRGPDCADDCPHDEAAVLWSAARTTFGDRAEDLRFLRSHGQGRWTAGVHTTVDNPEIHA